MLKPLRLGATLAAVLATPINSAFLTETASAADMGTLNAQVRQAVCTQNWGKAVKIIDQMIAITPSSEQIQHNKLETYKVRIQNLYASKTNVDSWLLSYCATPKEVFQAPIKEVFQAPIKRREHGIPVIDVTFNGTQTFEMLVDTGASKTVITQQMAAALGVFPTETVKASTASDKEVDLLLGSMNSIEAAGAVVKNTLVGISPILDTGLLGQDLFSRYDVAIKKNVVEFRPQQR